MTNYLYGIDYNGGGGNWIRVYDLNKYITSAPANTAPTVHTPLPDTTTGTNPVVLTLTNHFTDAETPAKLTFTVTSNSNGAVATASITGSTLTITDGTVNGSTTVVIRATDPKGLYVEDTMVVTRNFVPANTKPKVTSAKTASAKKLALFTYTATATDAESTPTITIDQSPSWLTVSGATISGTPSQTAVDTRFRVIASDGTLKDTAIVTVTIGEYDNSAPTVTDTIDNVLYQPVRSASLVLADHFTDAETPANLTYSVTANSNEAVVTVTLTENIELTPGINGESEVVIRATDPQGLFVEDTFTVTVDIVGISLRKSVADNSVMVGSQRISLAAGVKINAISILDLRGRELFRQSVTGSNVVVPTLGAGVQILRIETTAGIQTVKIGGR